MGVCCLSRAVNPLGKCFDPIHSGFLHLKTADMACCHLVMSLRSRERDRCIGGWVGALLGGVATLVLARRFITRFEVSGESMSPALHPGDYLICESLSPFLGLIRRGSLVVIESPAKPGLRVIKRVAGVGGDYISSDVNTKLQVPPGHLFVVGDNPAQSTDSRSFGPVPAASVVAVARIRYRRGARPPGEIPA